MMNLYWLKTESASLGLGIGITARSEQDAKSLLDQAFGSSHKLLSIRVVTDFAELDQNHVVPNMGNHLKRGIWFPKGYDHISD